MANVFFFGDYLDLPEEEKNLENTIQLFNTSFRSGVIYEPLDYSVIPERLHNEVYNYLTKEGIVQRNLYGNYYKFGKEFIEKIIKSDNISWLVVSKINPSLLEDNIFRRKLLECNLENIQCFPPEYITKNIIRWIIQEDLSYLLRYIPEGLYTENELIDIIDEYNELGKCFEELYLVLKNKVWRTENILKHMKDLKWVKGNILKYIDDYDTYLYKGQCIHTDRYCYKSIEYHNEDTFIVEFSFYKNFEFILLEECEFNKEFLECAIFDNLKHKVEVEGVDINSIKSNEKGNCNLFDSITSESNFEQINMKYLEYLLQNGIEVKEESMIKLCSLFYVNMKKSVIYEDDEYETMYLDPYEYGYEKLIEKRNKILKMLIDYGYDKIQPSEKYSKEVREILVTY